MPAFAVERTLGRLGKWLRLLGFDTMVETELPRSRFSATDVHGRILLTRTRRLPSALAALKPVFVESDFPFEQLREVVAKTGLKREDVRPFTRCLRCNVAIEAAAREMIQGRVPDHVWLTQAGFSRCPRCRRVYWRGSHTQRSLAQIDSLFKQ